MKNNILAIIVAAGTAVVGSSLFSAPTQALTVEQDVNVEIKVPEVLYLRTFDTISLTLDGDDLIGGTSTLTSDASGNLTGKDNSSGAVTTGDASDTIDQTSPFDGVTGGAILKEIDQLYAVWSNNPKGVTVTLAATTTTLKSTNLASTAQATFTNLQPTGDYTKSSAVGLDKPMVGGASFDLNLTGATEPGTYNGGKITVTVTGNP